MSKTQDWGPVPLDLSRRCSSDFHPFHRWIVEQVYYDTSLFYSQSDAIDFLKKFELAPSVDVVGQLAYWPSRQAYDQGEKKRVRGKPGRILRKIFPDVSDDLISRWAEYFNENFVPRGDLKVITSRAREDFAAVYMTEHARYLNPNTTDYRKSLATSCMRYQFNRLDHHPAEAYGSGEFQIIWIEDDNNHLHARCVARLDPPVAAPIYGVSEFAIDMVEKYLTENDIVFGHSAQEKWRGAKLLALPTDGGFIGPYLDLEPRRLSRSGDHLIIEHGGEVSGSDHEGVLSCSSRASCAACGHDDEDDLHYPADDTDTLYCTDCLSYCEYYQEYYRYQNTDEVVVGWYAWGNRSLRYENWSETAIENHAVLHFETDAPWSSEIMTETTDGEFVPTDQLEHYGFVINDDGYAERELEDVA